MQFAPTCEQPDGHHASGPKWLSRLVGDGEPGAGAGSLTAQLKTADGREVATATFDFSNGYATVTVKTVASGILAPGLHGMHVHSIGKCEPNSVAPNGVRPETSCPPVGTTRRPGTAGCPRVAT